MSEVLHDIRARFAAAPLFDDELTKQLNDYERRTGSYTTTMPTGHSTPAAAAVGGHSVGPFRSVQPGRAGSASGMSQPRERTTSVGGASVWRTQTAQLPPEIQRPAAVEWLLAYQGKQPQQQGGTLWSQAMAQDDDVAHSAHRGKGNNGWDAVPPEQRGLSVRPVGRADPPGPGHRRDHHQHHATTPGRSGGRGSPTPSRRRRHAEAGGSGATPIEVKRKSTFAADDDDDDDDDPRPSRRPGAAAATTRADTADDSPPSRRGGGPGDGGDGPQSRRGGGGGAASSGYPTRKPQRAPSEDPPRGGGGGGDGRKTTWEGNDSDDTANRRLEPTTSEDWAWRKLENVDDNIARALARRGIQQAKLREIGAVPPHTKVSGGVQTESTVSATAAAVAKADVGNLRLVDDAAAAYKARSEHHPSNRTPPQPLLLAPMRPINRADDALPASEFASDGVDPSVQQAVSGLRDYSNISARHDLLSRLDQLQLQDEELVVSHLRDTAQEHEDYRRMRDHVAVANRQSEHAPAPLGGYLSVRDPGHTSEHSNTTDTVDRWRNAKTNNVIAATGQMANAVATTQALRKYGAENAQASEKRASQPEVTFRRGQKDAYDARRKWASVNFGLPTDGTNVDSTVARMDQEYRIAHAEAARQRMPQRSAESFRETDVVQPYDTTDYGFLSSRTTDTLDATHAQATSVYPVASGALRDNSRYAAD